jgi:GNAT superfamily N-acetyltransferase
MTIDLNAQQTLLAHCHIRTARSTDCQRVATLATQLGYPSHAEDIKRRMADMQDPKRYAIYVAEDPQHVVIGWIGIYVFTSIVYDKFAEISGLIVDQDARCHGVGAKLLLEGEQWAHTNGCHLISVRSNVMRERAHQFYLRHAYEFTKAQNTFVKCLESA